MMLSPDAIADARSKPILKTAELCGAALSDRGGLRRAGSEWNGPCPACGGRDRFWLDERKNLFLCRISGAAGDPIALVQHKHGCGFKEAVEMLSGVTAMPVVNRAAASVDNSAAFREKARHRAFMIWKHGKPAGALVEAYFARRGIAFPDWRLKAIRETQELAYWHWNKEAREFRMIHRGPAMLAAITDGAGKFMGVHRTWIDSSRENGKALIADPETGEVLQSKKVEGSQRGGVIVLREAAGNRALGEGIETVLSWADYRHDRQSALLCGVNLDNIAGKAAAQIPHPSLTVTDAAGRTRRVKIGGHEPDRGDDRCLRLPVNPDGHLTLIGDGDSDRYTTQAAMMRAQKRHALDGHHVHIDWADDGFDFNTMLKSRARKIAGVAA